MTLVDEFYKVGPGPSSSHTIGPMRITYDFYQRASKLPADQLAQATALRVNLFGSLSATGKGHGTERASLAGLDRIRAGDDRSCDSSTIWPPNPDKTLPGQAWRQDDQRLAQGHHLRRAQGRLPSPQYDESRVCWLATKCCLSRNIIRSAAASSNGRATSPPRRTRRNILIRRWRRCSTYTQRDKISLAQLAYANELAISGATRRRSTRSSTRSWARCARR